MGLLKWCSFCNTPHFMLYLCPVGGDDVCKWCVKLIQQAQERGEAAKVRDSRESADVRELLMEGEEDLVIHVRYGN